MMVEKICRPIPIKTKIQPMMRTTSRPGGKKPGKKNITKKEKIQKHMNPVRVRRLARSSRGVVTCLLL
jgi:hypothetical protein